MDRLASRQGNGVASLLVLNEAVTEENRPKKKKKRLVIHCFTVATFQRINMCLTYGKVYDERCDAALKECFAGF